MPRTVLAYTMAAGGIFHIISIFCVEYPEGADIKIRAAVSVIYAGAVVCNDNCVLVEELKLVTTAVVLFLKLIIPDPYIRLSCRPSRIQHPP